MKNFNVDELNINIEKEDSIISIFWSGESRNIDIYKILKPYFSEIVNEIENEKLVVDLKNMVFMNSSTMVVIIELVKNLNTKKIETELVCSKDSEWQRSDFKSLEVVIGAYPNISIKWE